MRLPQVRQLRRTYLRDYQFDYEAPEFKRNPQLAQPLPECDLTPDPKSVPDQTKLCQDFEFPVFAPEKKYS